MSAGVVFFVCYWFEPNHPAIAFIISDGDVRHLALRRRAVPMLDVGITDDGLAFVDRLNRFAFFLIKPFACDDDESLPCRMRVPITRRVATDFSTLQPAESTEQGTDGADALLAFDLVGLQDFGIATGVGDRLLQLLSVLIVVIADDQSDPVLGTSSSRERYCETESDCRSGQNSKGPHG